MRNTIAPYVARALLSPKRLANKRIKTERKRIQLGEPHRVTIYLRINDAYSYVLLQLLKRLEQRYSIEYDFRTILNLQPDMYPAPTLWANNAFEDCCYLADLYSEAVDFPSEAPNSTPQRDAQITSQLLHWELQSGYLDNALALFKQYWQGDHASLDSLLNPAVTQNYECFEHHLLANEARLKEAGHYLSAMLHYGGEWYWGINRLQYLERRLNDLGLVRKGQPEVVFDRSHQGFCKMMSAEQVRAIERKEQADNCIEVFFSARSPYSYIGLIRAKQLSEHYGIPLAIKPVLPMVMRRMQVPKRKGTYIAQDASREALLYTIPFGFIADPLGKGVENVYSLFEYAKSQNKEVELLASFARGVWSEGLRADTDKGLSTMVARAGLDWSQAQARLSDTSWRNWAQDNLAELYSYGQWGVPCFRFKQTIVFGQDRLDRIEHAISSALQDPINVNPSNTRKP
jgi:2-hydroxychromene-2-carboxylate isomerase